MPSESDLKVRFAALGAELDRRGFLSAVDPALPLAQLDYVPGGGALPYWRAAADDPARVQAQGVLDGWDWTSPQTDWANLRARAAALLLANDPASSPKLLRAVLLWTLDQLNAVRAALPVPLPAITAAQAKAGVAAKLNGGQAD